MSGHPGPGGTGPHPSGSNRQDLMCPTESQDAEMMKNLRAPVGLLLILVGLLWTLQGLDVIGGSAMSGKTVWAVIGPLVALGGLALMIIALRDRRSR